MQHSRRSHYTPTSFITYALSLLPPSQVNLMGETLSLFFIAHVNFSLQSYPLSKYFPGLGYLGTDSDGRVYSNTN